MEELLPAWLPKTPGMRLLIAGLAIIGVYFGARALRRSLPGISSATAAAPIDTSGLLDTSSSSSGDTSGSSSGTSSSGDTGVSTDPFSILDGGSYTSPPGSTQGGATYTSDATAAPSARRGGGVADAISGGAFGSAAGRSAIFGGAFGSAEGRSAIFGGALGNPNGAAALLGGALGNPNAEPAIVGGAAGILGGIFGSKSTTSQDLTRSLNPYGRGAGQVLTPSQQVQVAAGMNVASQRAHRGLSAPAHPNVAPVYHRGYQILD